MGAVKELYSDVRELLETTSMSVAEIAAACSIDTEFVEDVLTDLECESDGQPDEQQEWESFDPDC